MINILFGGNYKVIDGLTLCLMSMRNHTSEALNVYVLTADVTELNLDYRPITEQDRQFVEGLLKQKNPDSKVTLIKLGKNFFDWVMSSRNKLNQYTPFAFLRLFADEIKELPNKIIYLDTDIMLNGDINQLWNIDISNYELGVVKDRYGRFFIRPGYFNSGMLLMNMTKICKSNLFKRVRDICLNKKMKFPDQTALNKLCKNKLYLPRKFNEQGDLKADTVVQHFSNRFNIFPHLHLIVIKPWHIDKVHKIRKNFAYDDVYREFLAIKGKTIEQVLATPQKTKQDKQKTQTAEDIAKEDVRQENLNQK